MRTVRTFLSLTLLLLLSAFAIAQKTTYTSTDLGFKATFPSEVKSTEPANDKTLTGHPFVAVNFYSENANGSYVVLIATYSDVDPSTAPELSLKSVLTASATAYPGEYLDHTTECSSVAPQPCLLGFIVMPAGTDHPAMKLINMVVVKGNHVYEVMFGNAANTTPDAAEVAAFFDSFKLL